MSGASPAVEHSSWHPGPAWLFCPADRPDRYLKALAVADVVVLDLEDAVAAERKPEARHAVEALVREGTFDHDRTVLRVNAVTSPHHAEDVALRAATGIRRVMLAKTESVAEVVAVTRGTDVEIVALLETAAGIDRTSEIAAAPGVVAVMWGADDLIASMGGSASRRADGSYRDVARFARSRSLIGTKAAGRLAIDAVYMAIPDHEGLRTECEDAVAIGFDAKVAIHPDQVAIIRAAYRPSTESVDWARRLLAHVGADRGVTTFEGRMVDGPIYAQAEQILRRADSA